MPKIYVLPKWNYKDRLAELEVTGIPFRVIDTTSGSGDFRGLSPFVLGPCKTYLPGFQAQNFENLWQYSKVYTEHILTKGLRVGKPNEEWYNWRDKGWANPRAVRYPMGRGRKPEYSWWEERKFDYVTARKQIYAVNYHFNVIKTEAFARLRAIYNSGTNLILLDYDAYDHQAMGRTLKDVINDPNRKCGHAFILAMILTGQLPDCVEF